MRLLLTMMKKYDMVSPTMKNKNIKDPKVTPELGADKDGMQKGGIVIQTTNPTESQTVDVKGTKRIRPEKKPVKATWY